MSRWRVKSSRYTPTWFHACEVDFIDATDAHEAKALIEARSVEDNEVRVWAITPATPEMEAKYLDWRQRCEQWRLHAAQGQAPRGLMDRGFL